MRSERSRWGCSPLSGMSKSMPSLFAPAPRGGGSCLGERLMQARVEEVLQETLCFPQ